MDVHDVPRMRSDMVLYFLLFNYRVRTCNWSQTRTVYLDHMRDCFHEQGLVYDPETGDLCMEHGLRAEPPDSDSDSD